MMHACFTRCSAMMGARTLSTAVWQWRGLMAATGPNFSWKTPTRQRYFADPGAHCFRNGVALATARWRYGRSSPGASASRRPASRRNANRDFRAPPAAPRSGTSAACPAGRSLAAFRSWVTIHAGLTVVRGPNSTKPPTGLTRPAGGSTAARRFSLQRRHPEEVAGGLRQRDRSGPPAPPAVPAGPRSLFALAMRL